MQEGLRRGQEGRGTGDFGERRVTIKSSTAFACTVDDKLDFFPVPNDIKKKKKIRDTDVGNTKRRRGLQNHFNPYHRKLPTMVPRV
jgi:hypothetical protein